jgi:hypothetical protein
MKKLLLTILFVLLIGGPAWGATVFAIPGYYESGASSCDDVTAADTSGDLEAALTTAGASGFLYICEGTYTDAQIDSDDSLKITANNQTITGVGNVILDGHEAYRGVIYLDAESSFTGTTIDNLIIRNSLSNGIHSGIGTDNDLNTEIKNCIFEYIGYTTEGVCDGATNNGIVMQEVKNVSIHDNIFRYIEADGIYGSCTDCSFYDNTFSNLDMGYVGCANATAGDCIHLVDVDDTESSGAQIYDNYCDKSNSDGKTGFIVTDSDDSGSTGIEVYNNIVLSGGCGAMKINGPEGAYIHDNRFTNKSTRGENTNGPAIWSNGATFRNNIVDGYNHGINLATPHSIDVDVYQNTFKNVNIGVWGESAAFDGIDLKNNIFILDSSTGTNIMIIDPGATYAGSNNDFFPNGISAADLYDFKGTDYATLALLQAGESTEDNSTNTDPQLTTAYRPQAAAVYNGGDSSVLPKTDNSGTPFYSGTAIGAMNRYCGWVTKESGTGVTISE